MALTGVAGVAITVYIHISTTYVQYYFKVVLDGILLGMVLVALVLLFSLRVGPSLYIGNCNFIPA